MEKQAEQLKQGSPLDSLEAQAMVSLQRTTDHFRRELEQTLKDSGLTAPQYTALRILGDFEQDGLQCSDIGKRMVSQDPDVTRLLARLKRARLVSRRRHPKDKRVVFTRITKLGIERLRQVDPVVKEGLRQAFSHIPAEKLVLLVELLGEARGPQAEEAGSSPLEKDSKAPQD